MTETRSDLAVEWTVPSSRPVDRFLLIGNRLLVASGLLALVAGVIRWPVLTELGRSSGSSPSAVPHKPTLVP